MDRIKEVQEDPAKRKQALKSMLCSDSLHLAVCIAMVVVGVQVGYNALAMFMTTVQKYVSVESNRCKKNCNFFNIITHTYSVYWFTQISIIF